MFQDAETWVAIAFVIFVGVMIYLGVGKKLTGGLDKRAETIKNQLDEAQRLREEAQHALAEYKRMQRDAAKEAEEILNLATKEAEIMRDRAEKDLADSIKRREEQAVTRIAQAEAEAVQQVRDLAIDVAMVAATEVLQERLDGTDGDDIITAAIRELPTRLN